MSPKFFYICLVLALGFLIRNDVAAQSAEKQKEKAATTVTPAVAATPEQNPDLAPAPKEQPYVVGDSGEKIYFLTDPTKQTVNSSDEKKSDQQPVKPAEAVTPKKN